MMKLKLKAALALVMALSMIPVSVPVSAQTAKAAVRTTVEIKQKAADKNAKTESVQNYAEGEAIILYKNYTSTAKSIQDKNALGENIEVVETYDFSGETPNAGTKSNTTEDGGISVSLVKSDKYSTEELISNLKKRSDVKYAEPNYKIKAMDTEDPYKKYQWNQNNQGQNGGIAGLDTNADQLKAPTNDEEKVIALVDTGMDYTHEDLEDVVWNNPYNSRQLRGEHGYDFINYDGDPMDDNGHGTHCSGIMAAKSDNGVGISGTANSENIKIMALKILDEEGYGYGMEAVGAYNYIYKAQQMGVHVVAVNNSWGSEGEDEESDILLEIINMVGEAGALTVCAAGNSGENNETLEVVPANLDSPYIISVAASNEKDELAAFSNYGGNVDLAAPGTDILSTVSYNTFNPVLYADKDALCSVYEDFETGSPVQVMEKSKVMDVTTEDGDICYGLDADSKGEISVSIDDTTYFGAKEDGTKSIKWTIEGAQEGGIYTLYLPYNAEVSSTPLYSSLAAKVSGPSGAGEDFFGMDQSILYISDGPVIDGAYEEDSETVYGGTAIDDGNYWNFFTGQALETVDEEQPRAMSVQLWAGADGDYTVYVDNMGVSRSDVDEEAFGKYDFYNGTSMATPHVTAAAAAVADVYGETALETKARILGSVRKSENLEGVVATGGVLDLSNIESPEMSLEKTELNDKNQIEIHGYYLTDAAVSVNGETAEPLEQTDRKIVIDGADYLNRSIWIDVEKETKTIGGQYFFMSGKKFDKFSDIYETLNGGAVVSGGENLYYVNNSGNVFKGTLYYDENEVSRLDWVDCEQAYETKMFGDAYKTAVDYTITNVSDFICLNKKLYVVLSIDVGYAEDRIIAYFDEEAGWKKFADLPEEALEIDGVTLAAYDGKIYLMGGVNAESGICSKQVVCYDTAKKEWTQAAELPEGRCFAKAMQTGNKLVLTLGGNGEYETPKNLIFDGSRWTVSKADMGEIVETGYYFYGTEDTFGEFPIITAQTGIVKDGIVYTDLKIEGVGDTFTYNVKNDQYTSAGYCLNRDTLDGDQLFATTMQDKLYVLYGWGYVEEDWDIEYWKKQKADDTDWMDAFYSDSERIHVCTMPIESGFIRVTDQSNTAGYAYILGTGYYLAGDTIHLEAQTFDEGYIKAFTVNGKKINADSKGKYIYEAKADGSVYDIKVSATGAMYVQDIFLDSDMIVLEKSNNAAYNSWQLYAEVMPESDDVKIIWTTSNAAVATVDSNGLVRVAKTAKVGQTATIRATAADRGTVYAECMVLIDSASVMKGSKVQSGDFTYKVTNFTEKNMTVDCVALNKKKAKKATVPATVKINGMKFKVTGISAGAMKNCKKLKSVTIGKNVTSIGKNAFKGCTKLTKVTIKAKKMKTFGKGLFKKTNKKLVVKVPKKSKKTYTKKLKKAGFQGTVK